MYVLQILPKDVSINLQNGQNDQVGDQVYQQGRGVGGGGGFLVMPNLLSEKISLCKKKKKNSNRWMMLSLLPQVFHLYENVNKSENCSKSVLMTKYEKKN